jgi:hypothetical protein
MMSNSLLVLPASLDRHTPLFGEGRVGQHQLVFALLLGLVRTGRLDKLEFRGPVNSSWNFSLSPKSQPARQWASPARSAGF